MVHTVTRILKMSSETSQLTRICQKGYVPVTGLAPPAAPPIAPARIAGRGFWVRPPGTALLYVRSPPLKAGGGGSSESA